MTLVDLDAVTVSGYRLRTGDHTTSETAVTGALVEAESVLEDELRRLLPLESRTESMRIRDADGRLYPKAWPITVCATNPIEGTRVLLGGTPDLISFTALIDTQLPRYATITYTGGFDADTLPVTLAHAIYDLARALAADSPAVPVGATSVSVGDVSVSFASGQSGGADAYLPGLSTRVKRWRNRFV